MVEVSYKKWECVACGYIYDEELGDEEEGFSPGTRFDDIRDDWYCPDCGASKEMFVEMKD
jgi:rubredoxin